MRIPRPLAPLLVLAVAACGGDSTPPSPSGPGTLEARIVSPAGDEGAALVRLVGKGIGSVTAGSGRVFDARLGDTVTVVIARETGGVLDFRVALADTTARPAATIVEVAGPDDQMRTALAGYTLEWVR